MAARERAGGSKRPCPPAAAMLVALVPALVLLAGVRSSGAAPLRRHLAGGDTGYASVHQICPAPKPHAASCLVQALVPSAGTLAGARPYPRAAGAASVGPAGGMTPSDLASAYGYAGAVGGGGQTVAIVDAFDDPTIEQDLATFDAHYGLGACNASNGCFSKVGQSGSEGVLPAPDTSGWTVEIALDVETVHSACPHCRILLVEANSEGFADLAAAVNQAVGLGATEVSNSYGGLEGELGAQERAAYDHPGTVIVAASGDSGYLDWDRIAQFLVAPGLPDVPASLAGVVAVGGTTLKLTLAGTRKSETVWNDSGPPSGRAFKQFAATGGGCSTEVEAPAWQRAVPGWAATGCGTNRLDDDIAAVADPYTGFDIYSSYAYSPAAGTGWQTVGGTSLSSPFVAALYALAGGSRGVSYPAATLYAHLGQASLYDVARGGNGYCDAVEPAACGEPEVNEVFGDADCLGSTACDAVAGFDGPSGVGAPTGLGAFGAPPAPTVVTGTAAAVTATSAVLKATINPNGTPVDACSFEWGTSTAYGQSAQCEALPGSGTGAVAVSASIQGLSPETLYYFRVSAANEFVGATGKKAKLKTRP